MSNRQYTVNCDLSRLQRSADYKTRDKVREKWDVVDSDEGISLCGNLHVQIKNNKVSITDTYSFDQEIKQLYEYIPSALLMYRLACTFEGKMPLFGPDGYKRVWEFTLRHKETGEVLQIAEHKGAAGIWTKYLSLKKHETSFGGFSGTAPPKSFIKDATKLMEYLLDENCAHPYDGLVAGGVA